jgi:biotin synthase
MMNLNKQILDILDKAMAEQIISRDEALRLMKIDLMSPEMYLLCNAADQLSRKHFNNLSEVYAQIGLDFSPCPCNCEFCSFGADYGIAKSPVEYLVEDIVQSARNCEAQGANGIYLMTTARYRFEKFIQVASELRKALLPETPMVANISDFNEKQAFQLAEAGFCAIYHAIRLNEGVGTTIPVERRIQTIKAAEKAGLCLHFCVEPVGPEHSDEAQVDLMFLGRELGAVFSGAMRRVCVPGTPVAQQGEIRWWDLARTVAVCRLVMGNAVLGHCTHEPNLPALLSGANLLWAEVGANPRDDKPNTENYRGWNLQNCQKILQEAGYEIRKGPAITANKGIFQQNRERIDSN